MAIATGTPASAVGPVTIPPSRDGVGASCVALPPGTWPHLLDFLVEKFPFIARDEWKQRLQAGSVVDGSGVAFDVDSPYGANQKIYYYRSLPAELPIPFEETVLFQDAYLIAVDKPHFLPVIPAGRYLQETLLVRLKRKLGIDTLAPMHRIDRETAGLVLFTVDPSTRAIYQALFRQRAVIKHYQAIAAWRSDLRFPMLVRNRLETAESFMKMRVVPGVPNAETHVTVMQRNGERARYALQPATGQRHQLRVHMEWLGMPIENDRIYPHHLPECAPGTAPNYSQPLQLLASALEFIDPLSGQLRRFDSQLRLQF